MEVPNTENGPLNDSVGQMPNQSTQVQSASVPSTSLVVNNQAFQQGNMEGAEMHAENAFRKKTEALNYLRMASKVDAFSSTVQSAVTMESVTRNMESAAKVFDKVLNSMDVEKAIQEGNMEGAEMHAENAFRKKTEALNYLRMASKVDAFSSTVQSAVTMESVTRNMESAAKVFDKVINSMDVEKVSAVMKKFEQQCKDLDVCSSVIDDAMGRITPIPLAQVHSLMAQVAEENGLDITEYLAAAQPVPCAAPAAASADRSNAEEMLKLKEFETASENDNLSSQIKDLIETETALKETLKIIEAEKENMSESLLWEIKKAEDLTTRLVRISGLTQKMDEISSIADERIEEMGMLNNEKSKLLEELNQTKDLLQEKEKELADMTLLVKEHINCSQNIENLMEEKESLTQENHQLHSLISAGNNNVENKLQQILRIYGETFSSLLKNERDFGTASLMHLLLNSINSLKKETLVTNKIAFFSYVMIETMDLLRRYASRNSSKPLSQDPLLQENGGPYLPSSLVRNITQSNVPSSTAATQFSQASNTLLPQNRMGSLPQPPAAQKRRLDPENMPSPLSQNMNAMRLSQNQNHPLLTANTSHYPANSFPQPTVSQPPRLPHNSGTMYNRPPGQFIPNSNADNYSVPPQRNTGYVDRTMLPHKQPNQSNKISNQDIYPRTNQANKPPPYNSNGTGFVPPVSQYGHPPNSGMYARYPSLVPNITQSNVPSSTAATQFNQASNTLLPQNRMGSLPQPPAAQKRRLDPDNMPSPISCSTTDTNSISDCNTSSASMPSPLSKRKCVSQDPLVVDHEVAQAQTCQLMKRFQEDVISRRLSVSELAVTDKLKRQIYI